MWQKYFYIISFLSCLLVLALSLLWVKALYFYIFLIPIILLGIKDTFSNNNVLYNYPIIGHIRYLMEFISPEIRQYFLEDDRSGKPYSRDQRQLIKERAHGDIGIHPFGTEESLNKPGYKFMLHSVDVKEVPMETTRLIIGGPFCKQPYNSSRLNISAMSFGALSDKAVLAMNKGASLGAFSQDTGEGGLTPYHLQYNADIVWEIGTGYFGCRKPNGRFDDEMFAKKANLPAVKMVSIKLSQGAKPGHGSFLPKAKITEEIARIRAIPMDRDCISPAVHPEFNTPKGLLDFVQRLRNLAQGKPIGFKLCIGKRSDFLSICKAMLETGILPDFISIDGAEGGTGGAPSEFSDYVGAPIDEALVFVHSTLVGCHLRDKIRLIASGKISDGFDILQKIAIGADICNVARAMMFAVGCIQAIRCHTNTCPTGVTTQNPKRANAINVDVKGIKVKLYHDKTLKNFLELVGACGIDSPDKLTPEMIWYRMEDLQAKNYAMLFEYLEPGALLGKNIPLSYVEDWKKANAEYYPL